MEEVHTTDSVGKPGDTMTPLPTAQIISVIMIQLSEAVNINILFPFVAFMVEDMGYRGKELGVYAGGLAAAFCAAQFCSSIAWGKFSDMYGRKLAIILGTIGAAIGMLVFGTSKTYTQAIIGRIASGLLSGNVGVLKSFLTEITDETNRGTGFSYMSTAWSLGCIVAPLAGGLLCRPAVKYPYAFASDGFFGIFPYVLPCLLCTIFSLLSALMCFLFMEESRRETAKGQANRSSKNSVSASTAPSTPVVSLRSIDAHKSGPRSVSRVASDAIAADKHSQDLAGVKMSPMSAAARSERNSSKPPSLSRRLKSVFGASDASAKSPRYAKIETNDESDGDSDEEEEETKETDEDKANRKANARDSATQSLLAHAHGDVDIDEESPGKSIAVARVSSLTDISTPRLGNGSNPTTPSSRRVLRKVSIKTVVHTYGDEDACTCSFRSLCCFRCKNHGSTSSRPTYVELQSMKKQDSLSTTLSDDTDIEGGGTHALKTPSDDENEAKSGRNVSRMMKMVLGKLTLGYSLPFSKSMRIPASAKYSHLSDERAGEATDETLLHSNSRSDGLNDTGETDDDSKSVLRQKTVLLAVGTYGMLAMGFMLLDETIPLFLKLDGDLGGMSFDSSEIGFLLSICGAAVLVFAYWGLPWLMKIYSKSFLYKASILLLIPTVLGWPILAELKLNLFQKWFNSSVNNVVTWVLLSLIGVMRGVTAVVAFTVVTIQVNHSVFDRHLGFVNGLGQSLASLARACGPALGGALWSLSMTTQFVFLNFIVVAIILVLSQVMSSNLPAWLEMKRQPREVLDESYVEEEVGEDEEDDRVMALYDLNEEKDSN